MSKIFNTKEFNVYEMIDFIKNGIENEVPFVNITKGMFGGDTIMLLISFEPKSEWNHGYVENSNYFRMMVEDNGVIEEFTVRSNLHKIMQVSNFLIQRLLPHGVRSYIVSKGVNSD